MPTSETDRIEKTVLLPAPRARVWRALTDAGQFGSWFGVMLPPESFAPGARVRGPITHPGYEHLTMELTFRLNDEGWTEQMKNVERHLSQGA